MDNGTKILEKKLNDIYVRLASLSSLAASLTNLETYTDQLEGFVDGIEGSVDGLEGLATSLNGYADGLEGLITTLNTYVDGVEASLTALEAKLPALGQAAMAASQPVVIASDQTAIPVTGGGGTQYTEGDADATITGNAVLMEVAANILQPVQGTVADGLLVNLGTNNDISGTVAINNISDPDTVQAWADIAAAKTALELIDNTVAGSELQVDIVTLPALVAGTALVGKVSIDQVTANANEVVTKAGSVTTETNSAAIKTAVELIDNAISGTEMQVDIITSALPTGAATETTLSAIQTSVETIDNAVSGAGFNITQLGSAAVPIGAGTEAAAIRVTLPTDGTGQVTEINSGSIKTSVAEIRPVNSDLAIAGVTGSADIATHVTAMETWRAANTGKKVIFIQDFYNTTTGRYDSIVWYK